MAETTERTLTKEMDVPLTNIDMANKAAQLGELKGKIDELEKAFDKVKTQHKADLSPLEDELEKFLEICRTKKERRMVDVTERRDLNRAMVQYIHDGIVLDERAMTADELLQPDLFDANEAVKADPEAADEAPIPVDEQIARDIQESTNPNTASSAVQ